MFARDHSLQRGTPPGRGRSKTQLGCPAGGLQGDISSRVGPRRATASSSATGRGLPQSSMARGGNPCGKGADGGWAAAAAHVAGRARSACRRGTRAPTGRLVSATAKTCPLLISSGFLFFFFFTKCTISSMPFLQLLKNIPLIQSVSVISHISKN